MNSLDALPVAAPEPIAPHLAGQLRENGSLFSVGEMQLTFVILGFGLVALLMFYLLVRSDRATPFLMRIYVVIILVFGTLLVVSSSYSTEQIAPVVGFFGTIAGYLLGRSERKNDGD